VDYFSTALTQTTYYSKIRLYYILEVLTMKVYESRVRKCKDVSIIIDKKMRERRIEYEKYIIPLSESNPFEVDEFVKMSVKWILINWVKWGNL
jgi:hypothetical protein